MDTITPSHCDTDCPSSKTRRRASGELPRPQELQPEHVRLHQLLSGKRSAVTATAARSSRTTMGSRRRAARFACTGKAGAMSYARRVGGAWTLAVRDRAGEAGALRMGVAAAGSPGRTLSNAADGAALELLRIRSDRDCVWARSPSVSTSANVVRRHCATNRSRPPSLPAALHRQPAYATDAFRAVAECRARGGPGAQPCLFFDFFDVR